MSVSGLTRSSSSREVVTVSDAIRMSLCEMMWSSL
jgi:hypothetical protein